MPEGRGTAEEARSADSPFRLWEATLVALLLVLAGVAWWVTAALADPDMQSGLLTTGASARMAGGVMDGDSGGAMGMGPAAGGAMGMGPGAGAAIVLGLFLLTWLAMMAAMMLPSLAPVVLTFDRWARRTGRGRSATALFVAGYLLVWGATGLLVFGGGVVLGPFVPSGETGVRLGAGLLLLAGAYQLTPLKERCLQHCRSPLAFLAHHAGRLTGARAGGTGVGAVHGAYCVGCCWALMLVLVLLGMMSLVWMAAVAAVIFLEKTLPRRWAVGLIVGLLLIGLGGALLAWPRLLPS